jgi:hypothetical protein
MPTTGIHLFATKGDWLRIFGEFKSRVRVKYTRASRLNGPHPITWWSGAEIPHLGIAAGDQLTACDMILVLEESTAIRVETRVTAIGQRIFDVDQRLNPDSVAIWLGGEWKDEAIIAGRIATISKTPSAQTMMRTALRSAKKHFRKVNAYWIGLEAFDAWKDGKRLTYAIQSPPEYDLGEEPE